MYISSVGVLFGADFWLGIDINSLEKRHYYCHAYLGLFLKHHSDTVLENAELLDAITELRPKMTDSWKDLKQALTHTSTLVSFCKNSLLTAG